MPELVHQGRPRRVRVSSRHLHQRGLLRRHPRDERRSRESSLASSLVLVSLAPAAPALAECVGNPNRWPAFERVAPTARQVVIGRVVDIRPPGADRAWMSDLRPGGRGGPEGQPLPPARSTSTPCTRGSRSAGNRPAARARISYALPGDRIALALGGKLPGVKGRVNSAAWIEGSPSSERLESGPAAHEPSTRSAERWGSTRCRPSRRSWREAP